MSWEPSLHNTRTDHAFEATSRANIASTGSSSSTSRRQSMPRVLFTSVCRPLGERYGDAPSVGYELLYGQVTRSQGLFSPRANHVQFSAEYIAENLESPTTVLHYPSRREVIRELAKGYDYIGIAFVLATFHRMKELVALVRKHSPRTQIILGGYGTVLSDEELAWSTHLPPGKCRLHAAAAYGERGHAASPSRRSQLSSAFFQPRGLAHRHGVRRPRLSPTAATSAAPRTSSSANTSSCLRPGAISLRSSSAIRRSSRIWV